MLPWWVTAQWLVVAVVLLWRRPAAVRPGLWSAVPLLAIGLDGGAALLTAVILLGTGALEPGQPRRRWLIAALSTLAVATHAQADTLWLWVQLRAWFSLGMDQASWVVDYGMLVVRGSGWRCWCPGRAARARERRQRGAPRSGWLGLDWTLSASPGRAIGNSALDRSVGTMLCFDGFLRIAHRQGYLC